MPCFLTASSCSHGMNKRKWAANMSRKLVRSSGKIITHAESVPYGNVVSTRMTVRKEASIQSPPYMIFGNFEPEGAVTYMAGIETSNGGDPFDPIRQ